MPGWTARWTSAFIPLTLSVATFTWLQRRIWPTRHANEKAKITSTFITVLFQELRTKIDNTHENHDHLHHEKYDLTIEALSTDKFQIPVTKETVSLSGFVVILARSASPFYWSTYLPTSLLTMTSFIGFLIPVDVEEGRRMALLITILLMLVTISGIERNLGPVVSTNYHPNCKTHYKSIFFRRDTWLLWTSGFYSVCYLWPRPCLSMP